MGLLIIVELSVVMLIPSTGSTYEPDEADLTSSCFNFFSIDFVSVNVLLSSGIGAGFLLLSRGMVNCNKSVAKDVTNFNCLCETNSSHELQSIWRTKPTEVFISVGDGVVCGDEICMLPWFLTVNVCIELSSLIVANEFMLVELLSSVLADARNNLQENGLHR